MTCGFGTGIRVNPHRHGSHVCTHAGMLAHTLTRVCTREVQLHTCIRVYSQRHVHTRVHTATLTRARVCVCPRAPRALCLIRRAPSSSPGPSVPSSRVLCLSVPLLSVSPPALPLYPSVSRSISCSSSKRGPRCRAFPGLICILFPSGFLLVHPLPFLALWSDKHVGCISVDFQHCQQNSHQQESSVFWSSCDIHRGHRL